MIGTAATYIAEIKITEIMVIIQVLLGCAMEALSRIVSRHGWQ